MDFSQAIDGTVSAAIEQRKIVGGVVLVMQDGALVHDSAYGLSDRAAGMPMQRDAIFRLSSLTKPIVASTVLAMADAGQLNLADPVTRYLPDFQPRMADGSVPEITLKHLLTHTSGLGGEPPMADDEKSDPKLQAVNYHRAHLGLEDAIMRLCRVPLAFAPGTNWAYAWGIDVLGAVIEKITGGRLGEAVKLYVTGPLGMVDTAFSVVDPDRLALPYADGDAGAVAMQDPHFVPNPFGGITTYSPGRIFDPKAFHSGGSGMAGTAGDFMKIVETLRTGGGDVLRSETVAEGVRNQLPDGVFAQAPGWGFGYFGAVHTDPRLTGSPLSTGAIRWGGIFGHTWTIDPARQLSIVAMTNTGLEGCDGAFPDDLRRAICGVESAAAAQ